MKCEGKLVGSYLLDWIKEPVNNLDKNIFSVFMKLYTK